MARDCDLILVLLFLSVDLWKTCHGVRRNYYFTTIAIPVLEASLLDIGSRCDGSHSDDEIRRRCR